MARRKEERRRRRRKKKKKKKREKKNYKGILSANHGITPNRIINVRLGDEWVCIRRPESQYFL